MGTLSFFAVGVHKGPDTSVTFFFLGFHRLRRRLVGIVPPFRQTLGTRNTRVNAELGVSRLHYIFFRNEGWRHPSKSRNGSCPPDIYTDLPIAYRLCS